MSVIFHNGKPATCLKCGKKCTFGGRNQPVTLENNGRIQELEDTLYFCSREHFKSWAKSYKSNRTKQNKASIKQYLLDNAEKKAEDDDLYAIYQCLSAEIKREMVVQSLALCYSLSDHTIGGVLNQISRLKERRENKETLYVSDI